MMAKFESLDVKVEEGIL